MNVLKVKFLKKKSIVSDSRYLSVAIIKLFSLNGSYRALK